MGTVVETERWQRLQEIFDEALARSPEERAAYVRAAAGDDARLAADVEALLAGAEDAHANIERTIGRSAARLYGVTPGARIGPYRVVDLLGAGGMGAVYLAERDDGEYAHRVAIKIVPGAMSSPEAVARFRDERQVLATLDHPGIVRLLDGGRTEDGLPYLVMEHVEGTPLAAYARALTVRARVALVVQIADALQAAHQRLVVHRDVKPSNVLVGRDGVPKLLDFGIAKLLDPAASREAETRTGMVAFTTEYASPEQVRGERVTVATDVYSLGAVLFELLVGHPPQRAGATPLDTLRDICEREPARPSAVAPEAIRRQLAGDLDNIVLRALAKQPGQRYASAADLAADLRAYLEVRPVVAREATFGYRARKLLARHRGKVALATLVAGALATATVLSIAQARRADHQAHRAEGQRRILLVERGRQELAAGHAGRALPYLAEALRAGEDTPAVRFLIAAAMHPLEQRVATWTSAGGNAAAEWSPDGTRIAITSMVSHGELRSPDGSLVARFEGDGSYQGRPAFSSDSRWLAALDGFGRLYVWDATTGARRLMVNAHPAAPGQDFTAGGVSFIAGDTRLVTGGADRRLALWDSTTGAQLAAVDLGSGVAGLAVSHDDSTVAISTRDGRITLWDTSSLSPRGVVRDVAASGEALGLPYSPRLAFSPDGARLYTTGSRSAHAFVGVTIWDLAHGRAIAEVPGMAFALSPDGARLATGDPDGGLVQILDATTGALQHALVGHQRSPLTDLRWSRDGTLLASAGQDATFRLWDATTGAPLAVIEAMTGAGDGSHSVPGALSAIFSTDARSVLALSGIGASMWRADHGALLHELRASKALYAATWSPDEQHIAIGTWGDGVMVWAGDRQTAAVRLPRIYDANWTPDGTRFVVAGEGRIAMVLGIDGARVLSLEGHTSDVFRASFSPDGTRVLTASGDKTARIWDAATGRELHALPHDASVMAAAWSRDGAHIVTAGWNHGLHVWNAATGALELTLDGGGVHYLDVTFSPDGRELVAGGAGSEVEVWDLATRTRRLMLEGHTANVTTAVFSPDGTLIATASSDHSARIWDAASGALLATLPHAGEAMSAQWSRDGSRLLTAGSDGMARTWDVRRSTITPDALDAFIADRVPYRLVDGRLEHIATVH